MTPSIEIDEEIFELLKSNAEVFVDTPNDVLRRLLGLDANGHRPPTPAAANGASQPALPMTTRSSTKRQQSSKTIGKAKSRRAAPGSLLPESEYEEPILRYLAHQDGGRAPSREVVEAVGAELDKAGRFERADKEQLGSGEIRWKNRAAFVRLRLVERGELDGQAPRGTWQITDKGRQRLSSGQ
ncbi:MAG: hypothetical protein JO227_16505 [Acetobacteraceae bacterium]|nr:hypothetical protein [Acetobacteraceae bacterium]